MEFTSVYHALVFPCEAYITELAIRTYNVVNPNCVHYSCLGRRQVLWFTV